MQSLQGKWVALALATGCAAGLSSPAYTTEKITAATPGESAFQDRYAVDHAVLESMRGGFDIAPGLKVSFGIERLVNLNGVLQTATRIDVPDAGKLLQPAQALSAPSPAVATSSGTGAPVSMPAATDALPNSTAGLVQSGLGNTFSPAALSQGAVGTFIQNSVSNQTIQSLTIINATTNSLELLKGANLQSTLFDALTQSAGTR